MLEVICREMVLKAIGAVHQLKDVGAHGVAMLNQVRTYDKYRPRSTGAPCQGAPGAHHRRDWLALPREISTKRHRPALLKGLQADQTSASVAASAVVVSAGARACSCAASFTPTAGRPSRPVI